MSSRTPRNVRPRLVTGLLLTGTAIGLAATPATAIDMNAKTDARVWLASGEGGEAGEGATVIVTGEGGESGESGDGGEGGEAGEGAAPKSASLEASALIELGLLEGHLAAALRLYEGGAADEGAALASHPEAEFMDELRERLEELGVEDIVSPSADRLAEALMDDAAAADIKAAGDVALAAIIATEASVTESPRHRFDAILHLARSAAHEATEGSEDGKIEDIVALEESRGFLAAARSLAEPLAGDVPGADAVRLIDDAMDTAFPDGIAAGAPVDPSVIHGAAARIEILSLSVK